MQEMQPLQRSVRLGGRSRSIQRRKADSFNSGSGMLDIYTGEAKLRELISYVDRIYLDSELPKGMGG